MVFRYVILLALSTLLPAKAGYCHAFSDRGHCERWESGQVVYTIDPMLQFLEQEIVADLAKVNLLGLDISLQYGGITGAPEATTKPNITISLDDDPEITSAGYTNRSSKGDRLFRAWVHINAATLSKYDNANREFAYRNTIRHEVMHALGVGHMKCNLDDQTLMCSNLSTDRLYWDRRTRAALRKIYGTTVCE